MGNVHLVTGYAGQAHVTAADNASLFAALVGGDCYVLNRGNKFAATVVTNNTIRVADGDLLFQGRHVRLGEDSTVDLTIENGTSGYYRNDLIVARYSRDITTGVEDCNLVVIKGTAASNNPTDPEYTTGTIGTDTQVDMPLYRVPLSGLNVQELVPLFTLVELNLHDLSESQSEALKNINKWTLLGTVTNSKSLSVALDNYNEILCMCDIKSDGYKSCGFSMLVEPSTLKTDGISYIGTAYSTYVRGTLQFENKSEIASYSAYYSNSKTTAFTWYIYGR